MRLGTKSLLYGAHQFLIHPLFVMVAWWKLYGFPWDLRLWVAFLVHDWGYWGCRDMDGDEGKNHIWTGAKIMGALFDHTYPLARWYTRLIGGLCAWIWGPRPENETWFTLAFYHSRTIAKRYDTEPSRLCVADKLAVALEPSWLYLPRVWATGELAEYMDNARQWADQNGKLMPENAWAWHAWLREHFRTWVAKHRVEATETVPVSDEVAAC
jgi:hypothetical protein